MSGFLIYLVALLTVTLAQGENCTEHASNPAVLLLQKYIQINTTTYNDLTPAVEFWRELAASEGLPFAVYNFTEGFPIVVIKWPGSNSSAPSIMLNSHMDVVPADERVQDMICEDDEAESAMASAHDQRECELQVFWSYIVGMPPRSVVKYDLYTYILRKSLSLLDGWTYPPFAATLTNECEIYGRGSQDMKSVSIQYFYAMKNLTNTCTLHRDVHMTLMPDEEVGAENGMIKFLASPEFAAMNVGVEMDEGTSYPLPQVPLFVQDKVVWQILVTCNGVATHGSTFSPTNATATGKCRNVMDRLFQFRDEQYNISLAATLFRSGAYTSVNLNKINAGTANNIVPGTVTQVYDIRLGTTVNEETFDKELRQWIADAGENITVSYILKNPQSPATLTTSENPYWVAIQNAFAELNITFVPLVAPGSTDARFVRSAGIPAFGLSPMPNTPLLLHSVNEYLRVDTFLNGINVYKHVIKNLANIPAGDTSANSADYVVATTSS